jgi:uncharacterized protein with gpF-like domain
VYQSQLTGGNRRQEHIALHGKALRYDDAFWVTYPPNGWRCDCYVITESEHGAEKAGIKVEDSAGMMSEERILHAFRQKDGATVPEDCMADAYQALQEPDLIYEGKKARNNEPGRRILFSNNFLELSPQGAGKVFARAGEFSVGVKRKSRSLATPGKRASRARGRA